jgi:gliding motility-associated-like protein
VTVNPNPTVSVSPSAPSICAGGSATITASGAGSYSWSHSLGLSATQNVSPGSTTTYTVTGSSLGCTGTASVTVTVLGSPTVIISPSSSTVCSGQQVTLGASGATSYSWSTSQTSSIITPSPTSTTTYIVTGTDGNGCTASSSIMITVNSLPTVNISPSATVVCQGQQITLTASGALNYSWSPSGSGSVINPTPPVSMTYYVTGTDVNNCQGVDSIQVVVNPLPNVSLNASTTSICSGEQVTLTAGGASAYNWTPSGSGSVNVVNPTTTTTYSVVGTDANLCTASASVTVNVSSQFDATISPVANVCSNSLAFTLTAVDGGGVWSGPGITNTTTGTFNPSIAGAGTHQITYTIYGACGDSDNINIDVIQAPDVQLSSTGNAICNGESVVLTASGAASYSWSPSGSGTSNPVSPSATTTYFVTGTSGSCQNTASFVVTVHSLPVVSLISSDDEICTGEQSSLTASGANSYVWSNAGSGNPINVSPIVTTTYTVTGTDGNGCSNTADLTITVHDTPAVTLTASATSVCLGDTVEIFAGGADTYSWSPSGSGTGGEFFPIATTTYSVTGTSANGCSAIATVTVSVLSQQSAEILSSGPYCSADDPVVLNAVDGGGVWSGIGITNPTTGIFNPSTAGPGVHTITYTIAGNCGDADSKDFIVFESPVVLFVPTPITCDGAADGVLQLNISGGSQPYSVNWSNGSNEQILTDLSPGSYSVVVVDDNGCSVTSGFNIDDPGIPCDAFQPHVVVPNIFSPNGDGQNDILYVRGEGIVTLEFIVYSRWGEKIFETRNKDIGWDGTYQGASLDPAVFVYYLKATMINFEEIILQGDITLIK